MKKIRLGKTELMVTKTSIGCLPIQRCNKEEAVRILRRTHEAGVNFYDTAYGYSDSEEKLGTAFEGIRHEVIIATKSMAKDAKTITEHLESSLRKLKTDYIDLFQFHFVQAPLDPNDREGPYFALAEAKRKGYIRHIGATAHNIGVANDFVKSGLYETMQFPFSYLATDEEIALVKLCAETDTGFIAMKGLAGGLLSNPRACHAFMKEFDNVVPVWGVQTYEEAEQWLAVSVEDPSLDDELRAAIAKDKEELSGNFCRGCGYCAPCPVEIEVPTAARMNMLLRRSPWQAFYSEAWREKMNKINECLECGECSSRCPYGLDTPKLLKYMLEDYNNFFEEHKNEFKSSDTGGMW